MGFDFKEYLQRLQEAVPTSTREVHEMYAKHLLEQVGGRKNLLTLGILCIFFFFFCIFVMVLLLLEEPKRKKPFLCKERMSVPLIDKIIVSHDVIRLRFGLPSKDHVLGLPIGQHVVVYAPNTAGKKEGDWNGRPDIEVAETEIERKYTPVSPENALGHFDLMLKVYRGGEKPQFPDGGKMSQYLDTLKPGEDSIEIDGPVGRVRYVGEGSFAINNKIQQAGKENLGMIAGGTGITPMLQLIVAILSNPKDKTNIWLLFANQTEEDILERERLEDLTKRFPTRFKLWYTVDKAPKGWTYSSGFIDDKMLKEHMPPADPKTAICICGPPPMVKFACLPNLEKLDHAKENIITF